MALVLADRVKETTTTTGTGTVTLLGAAVGFQSFAVIGNANTTYYAIAGQTTSEWEVGIGTYTASGTTLARTTVLSNSAGTQPSALSFSAGTKDVFVTYPAEKSINEDASGNVGIGTTAPTARLDVAGNAIISTTDNTNAALRITQLGTGNALLVEDSTNPDSTPFVIDASGNVISGYTTSVINAGSAVAPRVQVNGLGGGSATTAVTSWSTGVNVGPAFLLSRSEGGTVGTQTIVDSGDQLGRLSYAGSDGTAFIEGARIEAAVDGTPGTSDMPGRLVFRTTAVGAATPTERVRIDSSGNVGIGTTTPVAQLGVYGTGQTTAAMSTSTGLGGMLYARDSGSAANNGGAIMFGANQGAFATIKGLLQDGASNTRGDLAFSTRTAPTDATLTERMRIDSSGNVGIGTSSPTEKLNVSGNILATAGVTGSVVTASNGLVVNSNTVSASYSIPSGSSAMSAGPMSVSGGVVVTVPTNSRWVVL